MGRDFQGLEGIHVQGVMDAPGKLRPDARDALKQLLRLQRAAQPLQLAPAAGSQKLVNGRGDSPPDAGQRHQPVHAFALHKALQVLLQVRHGIRGAPVSADPKGIGRLLLQEVGRLAQLGGHVRVDGALARHRSVSV